MIASTFVFIAFFFLFNTGMRSSQRVFFPLHTMTSSTHPVHQMVVAGVRPGVLLVQTTLKLMSGNTAQRKFANMNYIFITTALITFIIRSVHQRD